MSGLGYGTERQESGKVPLTKVAQTQTDYRDADVQTDPYSPEYTVAAGTQPEVLSLAILSYGMLLFSFTGALGPCVPVSLDPWGPELDVEGVVLKIIANIFWCMDIKNLGQNALVVFLM